MPVQRFETDVYVAGSLACKTFTPPAASIDNAAVKANAKLDGSKLQHYYRGQFGQPNSAATSERRCIGIIYGATGLVLSFVAGSVVKAVGAATVTIDLLKNGVSMLTTPITLNNASTNLVAQAGVLSGTPSVAAGDVLEVVTVATAGGGTLPTGVFAGATYGEDAQ